MESIPHYIQGQMSGWEHRMSRAHTICLASGAFSVSPHRLPEAMVSAKRKRCCTTKSSQCCNMHVGHACHMHKPGTAARIWTCVVWWAASIGAAHICNVVWCICLFNMSARGVFLANLDTPQGCTVISSPCLARMTFCGLANSTAAGMPRCHCRPGHTIYRTFGKSTRSGSKGSSDVGAFVTQQSFMSSISSCTSS